MCVQYNVEMMLFIHIRVYQVTKVIRVFKDPLVCREILDRKAPQDRKVFKEPKDQREKREREEREEDWVHRERKDQL